MTTTLDQAGRAAAADLHARARTVDTEAALAAITGSSARGGRGLRRARFAGRPVFVGAAAAVVIAVTIAGVLAFRPTDDGATVESGPAAPVEAADFGPVRATIFGTDSPTLRADLHAPDLLQDGERVAVAISGAQPGVTYSLTQCAYGDPNFNPAANCDNSQRDPAAEAVVGPDGTALLSTPAWAVFDGLSMQRLNDCRVTTCALEIFPRTDEQQTGDHPPSVQFARPGETDRTLDLRFDPSASAPPLPVLTVEPLRRDGDTVVARVTGTNLEPGASQVFFGGSSYPLTGMLTQYGGEVRAAGPTVDVGADGTLDVEVELPIEIVQDPALGQSIPPDAPVRCDAPEAVCQISLHPADDGRPYPERRLLPNAIAYPDLP